jgi:5-methylcytosine-specific restriction enzyme A
MKPHKKAYTNKIRDKSKDWYNQASWKRVRDYHLILEPVCRQCLLEGFATPAEDVDHIIPRKKRPDLQYDHSNLQSLCHSHHAVKTRKENV